MPQLDCTPFRPRSRGLVGALILSWAILSWSVPTINSCGLLAFLAGVSLQDIPLQSWETSLRKNELAAAFLAVGAVITVAFGESLSRFAVLGACAQIAGAAAILLAAWALYRTAEPFARVAALTAPALMWIFGAHIPCYRVVKGLGQLLAGHPVELGWLSVIPVFLALFGAFVLMQRKLPLLAAVLCLGGHSRPSPPRLTSRNCAWNPASEAD